jgi:hypothetical protein
MIKNIILCATVLVIIGFMISFILIMNPKKVKVVSSPYQTDVEMITRLFPKLVGIEKCFWTSGTRYKKERFSIGLTAYRYKGFVILTKNEAARLEKTYHGNKAPVGWEPSLITTPLGKTHSKCNWAISPEFNKFILDYGRYGTVYFDKSHSLLYFEISRDG